jgi:hypothetical protein
VVNQVQGQLAVNASYAGNAYYQSSSDAPVTVWVGYGPTACPGGSFNLCIPVQGANEGVTAMPGGLVRAGYSLEVSGSSQPATIVVSKGYEELTVTCANHNTPLQGFITVPMPQASYGGPFTTWTPSGNESSIVSYEGSVAMPDLCGGTQMLIGQPGNMMFAAHVTSSGAQAIAFRSHYNDQNLGRAGSWSATKAVVPLPLGS